MVFFVQYINVCVIHIGSKISKTSLSHVFVYSFVYMYILPPTSNMGVYGVSVSSLFFLPSVLALCRCVPIPYPFLLHPLIEFNQTSKVSLLKFPLHASISFFQILTEIFSKVSHLKIWTFKSFHL